MYGDAMPTNVIIRDLPDEHVAILKRRAAEAGQSMQTYLSRALIELASKPTMAELTRRVQERKARGGVAEFTTSEAAEWAAEGRL
jgi:antitoxin FitA